MDEDITLKNIRKFQEKYNADSSNALAETRIRNWGLAKASLDDDQNGYKFQFTIKLPQKSLRDPKHNSENCSFAFTNVLEDVMHHNSKLELSLSSNFIDFYDKLEKINAFYNDLLCYGRITEELINDLSNRYLTLYQNFYMCRCVVNKYGIVPTNAMPEVSDCYSPAAMLELLRCKIKGDALEVAKLKNRKERQSKRLSLLSEAYNFLAKLIGNPPEEFEYKNQLITPVTFKRTYIKSDLKEFATTTPFDFDNFLETYSRTADLYMVGSEEIRHASFTEIETAIIEQLKQGFSVWISIKRPLVRDDETRVLDDKIYNYHDLLKMSKILSDQALPSNFADNLYYVCITGVLIENDVVQQYLINDGFSRAKKCRGQFIMTPDFLKDHVITLALNRHFLREEMGR